MKKYIIIITALIFIAFSACRQDDLLEENDDETEEVDLSTYPDWTEETHGNKVTPNYGIVFNQTEVLRFDIKISSKNWAAMQSDLSTVLGSSGGPGKVADVTTDPMWVECSVKFKNIEWYNVGIRYKGNSSLRSYQTGNKKLSFKLDFDEFEDTYPGLKNQRFYGFKQLNLNNNYLDASSMREKVGADLFRKFGLASAKTSFCIIYINNGTSTQYYGVYALVEEVDDTVLESQFANGSGNLYKPDGTAASFAQGSYNQSQMDKKTNIELNDYSDVRALYDIINSSERTTNTANWKTNLEKVFNVDGFMKWLAANTVMQNWDTYGRMTHNYYLYNNPDNNLLTWIPWDNNEAFQFGKQSGALSLALSEVGSGWPLIKYLIEQPDYKLKYRTYMQQFINEVFIPSEMSKTYTNYYNLLKEHAYAEVTGYTFIQNKPQFDQAVETLKTHVQSRNDAVADYLK